MKNAEELVGSRAYEQECYKQYQEEKGATVGSGNVLQFSRKTCFFDGGPACEDGIIFGKPCACAEEGMLTVAGGHGPVSVSGDDPTPEGEYLVTLLVQMPVRAVDEAGAICAAQCVTREMFDRGDFANDPMNGSVVTDVQDIS